MFEQKCDIVNIMLLSQLCTHLTHFYIHYTFKTMTVLYKHVESFHFSKYNMFIPIIYYIYTKMLYPTFILINCFGYHLRSSSII